jgi:hypothetical protein
LNSGQARARQIAILGLLAAFALVLQATHAAGPVTLTSGRFELRFSAEGHPLSFETKGQAQELLAMSDPGHGFYLLSRDKAPLRFDELKMENGKLVASCGGGLPRVTFRIRQAERYLALRIERMEAVPAAREYSMHFRMNLVRPISVLALDYMTEAGPPGSAQVAVDWPHTWNRNQQNPIGGFALYLPRDEADEDETLLNIWANEGLPHPRVKGQWDVAAAHAWINEWLAQYSDQSRFWLSARTAAELYAAVPYAEKAGVRDVYLFTDTWRGGELEPFWAIHQLNWDINKQVFPRGEEDLRAFSDHLHARGMHLKLHWVSGGIGLRDPQYIGKSPDARLASWGRGRLVGAAQKHDGTLHFRPDPGVVMPFRLPAADWWQRYTCPPALHNVFDYDYMVVGNELIKVGSFEDTDKEVWCLKGCQRGAQATDSTTHADDEAVRGLISSYGQQFLPDNDSSLLEEMARNFAEMLNRCHIANTEYDGAEIHTYNGRMWGYHKFASLVYRYLDHPVTAYSSSGTAPPCNLEYRLNATKNLGRDRQKGIVAILPDQPFREASTLLDAQWGLSQMCAHGYTVYNIMKPEPLFGISVQALQAHGQTDQLLATARNWKRVNCLIAPEQRERMRHTLYSAKDLCEQAGSHEKSELLHVLVKGQGQWEIYPTRVLTRPGQEDTVWHDGQEHGAISPRQFLKPGQAVKLVNPFPAQAPRLVLRVLWAFDSAGILEKAAAGQGADKRGTDSAFEYAKTLSKGTGEIAGAGNISLLPKAEEMRNRGDTRFSTDGAALVIEAANALDQLVVNEDKLPEWSRKLDMTSRRGVGMWVTGDGSGALLTFQIPGGDYVVPVTFSGRRYIEIPNAQVAWSTGYWGWRMGNKRTYYDQVNWLKLGFGVLPAHRSARVGVEGLIALREFAAEMRNPVLYAGAQRLELKGAIASGQYLTWEGGQTAKTYDSNWNPIAELSVAADGFTVPKGEFECRITAEEGRLSPWLELQLMTRDKAIVIPDPEL